MFSAAENTPKASLGNNESSLGILHLNDMSDSLLSSSKDKNEELSSKVPHSTEKEKVKLPSGNQLFLQNFDFDIGGDDNSLPDLELDQEEKLMLEADFSDFEDLDYADNESGDENRNIEHVEDKITKTAEISPADSEDIDIGPRAGQGVGRAVDSASDVDTEDEIRAAFQHNLNLSKRPGLEGTSPLEEKNKNNKTLDVREGAEGGVVESPSSFLPANGGGDGSSGHTSDSGSTRGSFQTQTSTYDILRGLRFEGLDLERICPQGIEDSASPPAVANLTRDKFHTQSDLFLQLLKPTHNRKTDSFSIRPWGDESSIEIENLESRDQSCPADGSEEISNPSTIRNYNSEKQIVFATEQISARSSSLPTSRNEDMFKINSGSETFDLKSQLAPKDNDSLAFYTNLRDEYGQGDNFEPDNSFEFVSATEGLQRISMEQKKFEEENKFRQDDYMKSFSLSSSWGVQENLDVSWPSWMMDENKTGRVSIGKFIGFKTDPLGSLGGHKDGVERPHFGDGKELLSPRSSQMIDNKNSTFNRTSQIVYPKTSGSEITPVIEANSILSISSISKIIADASVSADPNAMAEMIMKLSREFKSQKDDFSLRVSNQTAQQAPIENQEERFSDFAKPLPRSVSFEKGDEKSEKCDLLMDWEPVRPSSISLVPSEITTSAFTAPNKPLHSVRFSKQTDEINTPSILIPQKTSHFPTSTPYCGESAFPLDFNGNSTWFSILSNNEPTPKMRSHRMEPRTILNDDSTLLRQSTVDIKEDKTDADSTITDDVFLPPEMYPRLSAGQDAAPNMTTETQIEKMASTLPIEQKLFQVPNQTVNSNTPYSSTLAKNFSKRTAILPSIIEKTNESFHPLPHNTFVDEDQTVTSTSNDMFNVETVADLSRHPKGTKKFSLLSSQKTAGSTTSSQLKDCATVSLQRTVSVKVPPELKFGDVACVGIAVEAHLPLQNLTSRWLKCNFQLINLTIDGRSLPTEISPFIFKQETIVEPNSSDQIKILYASRVPGAIVAQLQISSQPMVPNSTGQSHCSLSFVTLIAEAEHPNIQVLLGGKNVIDFGTIPEDSCTETSLGLVNVGSATVPIRLVIHGSSKAWEGFYFPKNNLDSPTPPARSLISPTIIAFKMTGQSNGSSALKVFNTQIAFRAPNIEAHALNSLASLSATLNVEIDIPGSSPTILHTFPIIARVGTVRLETLKNIEPLKLFSVGENQAILKVPLRNSGSIPLVLEATVSHSPQLFVITPHSLHIPPGQESEITIKFQPKASDNRIVSALLLTLFPGGPAYEIQMIAENVSVPQNIHLESNKHFLAWGGVPLQKSEEQTLILRNSSPSNDCSKFQTSIRGATEDFWLVKDGVNVHNLNFELEARKEFRLVVKFSPTAAKHSAAKVVIKPAGVSSVKPIRYVIPLVGYGGSSNIELVGLDRDRRGIYLASFGPVDAKSSKIYALILKNTGEWAAFVKVLASVDKVDGLSTFSTGTNSSEILVSPNEFIIESKKTAKVLVAIRSINSDGASHNEQISNDPYIGTLTILYGDEISRRRFRKALNSQSSALNQIRQSSVNFDVAYKGELIDEEDLPSTPNDIQLFCNGLKHCQVNLLTHCVSGSKTLENKQMEDDLRISLPLTPMEILPPVTSSPPVREIQMKEPKRPEGMKRWNVTPKDLSFIVNKSSQSLFLTQSLFVKNKSLVSLKFDFMWPGHMLNINPANGTIEAKKQINVMVTAVPSDANDWDGTIFLKCDNQQEEIRVSIKQQSELENFLPEEILSPVKIKTKEISFSPTVVGTSTEYLMEMTNTTPKMQQWILSSVAPAIAKSKHTTGDIRKVTYSIFRFTKLSGVLRPDERTEVPVTFLPLDEGHFSQKWELVTKDSAKTLHNVTVKLFGQGINKSENAAKVRRKSEIESRKERSSGRSSSLSSTQSKFPIRLSANCVSFPPTNCNRASCVKLQLNNSSQEDHTCRITPPKPPFYLHHLELKIMKRRYINLPLYFKPTQTGNYKSTLHIETDFSHNLHVDLNGAAIDDEISNEEKLK